MGFSSCQQVNCLKEVGLSLSIIALKHRQVRWKVEFKALIIAKVCQAQMGDMNGLPPVGILME